MPGIDNKALLRKADLTLSDLTNDGGLLLPAQSQKFMRLLIKEAVVLKLATVVPMRSHKQMIEKIKFAGQVLRAGYTATALPSADRAKPTFSKVELSAKLVKGQVNLDNETLEDNIERGALRQTIMTMMAEAISTDIDKLMINGDTASNDTFYALFDGILKAATSNIVNAGTVSLGKAHLRDMIKAMPQEYLRRKADLTFLTSTDAELDYRDSLADRLTALGDEKLENDSAVRYSSVPVRSIPNFPENLGGGSNCTNTLLLDPKNIHFGIWRDIRIETDKDIEAGVLKIVATMRIDQKYAHEPAVVKGTNVRVA